MGTCWENGIETSNSIGQWDGLVERLFDSNHGLCPKIALSSHCSLQHNLGHPKTTIYGFSRNDSNIETYICYFQTIMYKHTYLHTHVYIKIYIHTYTYIYVYICTYVCIFSILCIKLDWGYNTAPIQKCILHVYCI